MEGHWKSLTFRLYWWLHEDWTLANTNYGPSQDSHCLPLPACCYFGIISRPLLCSILYIFCSTFYFSPMRTFFLFFHHSLSLFSWFVVSGTHDCSFAFREFLRPAELTMWEYPGKVEVLCLIFHVSCLFICIGHFWFKLRAANLLCKCWSAMFRLALCEDH